LKGKAKKKQIGGEVGIVRTWGAAVLRPYTESVTDRFAMKVTLRSFGGGGGRLRMTKGFLSTRGKFRG